MLNGGYRQYLSNQQKKRQQQAKKKAASVEKIKLSTTSTSIHSKPYSYSSKKYITTTNLPRNIPNSLTPQPLPNPASNMNFTNIGPGVEELLTLRPEEQNIRSSVGIANASKRSSKKSADISSYGCLVLQTYQASYFPGDIVTGLLHVDLVKPFPGSKIVLKIKGKEYVFHSSIEGKQQKDLLNKNTIVEYEIPVFESQEDLQPAQLSIPFALKLPSTLPSSFFLSRNNLIAAVSYHM
jgi:hypothetical protein